MTTTLQARPTTYKGIKMRSRLEAGFAMWMDEAGIEWTYEPQCYASEAGQYLPDFQTSNLRMACASRRPLFFEVKPFVDQTVIAQLKVNTAIIRASLPDACLALVTPQNRSEVWFYGGDQPMAATWVLDNVDNEEYPLITLAYTLNYFDAFPWPDGYWKP